MFDKIDFSDLNKFIVSLGIILITLAVIIPWLFVKDVLNFQVTQSVFDSLTVTSKNLVLKKESLIDTMSRLVPLVCIFLFVVGGILIFYGLTKWNQKQTKIDDVIAQLQLEKLTKEVRPLTKEEKIKELKIEENLEKHEIIEVERTGSNLSLNDAVIVPPPTVTGIITETITEALAVEQLFFNKILERKPFEFDLQKDIRISEEFSVDILMQARISGKTDKIFEIKYFEHNINYDIIYMTLDRLNKLRTFYLIHFRKSPSIYFYVIYKDGLIDRNIVERLNTTMRAYISDKTNSNVQFMALSKSQLERSLDLSFVLA